MSDNLLMDAVGYIDDRYLNEYFEFKERLTRKLSAQRKRKVILLTAIAAAFLVIGACFSVIMLREVPTKPEDDQITWNGVGGTGGSVNPDSMDYQPPQFRIYGMRVSETLYNTYHSGKTDGYYCIQVGVGDSGTDAKDVVDHFMKRGIYAETFNKRIFLFPKQEDLARFGLTSSQQEEWYFSMISKPFYNHYVYGTPIIESTDISEWESIDLKKFWNGTVGQSYSSLEELKSDYEDMFIKMGYDPEAYIQILCFEAEQITDFDYLDHKYITYCDDPRYVMIIVNLWDLDLNKIKAISADEKIGSVLITQVWHPLPTS